MAGLVCWETDEAARRMVGRKGIRLALCPLGATSILVENKHRHLLPAAPALVPRATLHKAS